MFFLGLRDITSTCWLVPSKVLLVVVRCSSRKNSLLLHLPLSKLLLPSITILAEFIEECVVLRWRDYRSSLRLLLNLRCLLLRLFESESSVAWELTLSVKSSLILPHFLYFTQPVVLCMLRERYQDQTIARRDRRRRHSRHLLLLLLLVEAFLRKGSWNARLLILQGEPFIVSRGFLGFSS